VNRNRERLLRALGCGPVRERLLEQALTHRSAANENNERLEFLGDALLGFVIAEYLTDRFPDADEGRLSRLRASLVKRETLARIARRVDLGDHLRLGTGELRAGGHARESILADALEAVFAAIYLDRGMERARESILSVFEGTLEVVESGAAAKDPKTLLQERLQARRRPLPVYEVLEVTGSQHEQRFRVCCRLSDGEERAEGRGTSRRRAEQQAAANLLGMVRDETGV
jgi:ribonuclease-3